jgi:hypothetical protein
VGQPALILNQVSEGSSPFIPTIVCRVVQVVGLACPDFQSGARGFNSPPPYHNLSGSGQKVSHLIWDQGIKGVRFPPPRPFYEY